MEEQRDIITKLVEIDQRSKSNTKRLDHFEQVLNSVYELTTAVKLLAEKQDRMASNLEDVQDQVEELEQKPAKRWDGLIDKIIAILCAAILGFILAKFDL